MQAAAVASLMIQMYCALVAAQAWMIWNARKIDNGQIKKAFVHAYFGCFTATTAALVWEHLDNAGTVNGGVASAIKLIIMIMLTLGYGWFSFFQPPVVFADSHKAANEV